MQRLGLQSAMEYLMTYGWAILIIAVVLGALFGLGFFNSANLAPKVGPGACQVYRPNGPGSTSFVNLEGTCNNELPQYVGRFSTVNGQSFHGNITIGSAGFPLGNSPRSAFAWVNNYVYTSYHGSTGFVVSWGGGGSGVSRFAFYGASSGVNVCYSSGCTTGAGAATETTNVWYFIGVTYDGAGTLRMYQNGQLVGSAAVGSLSTNANSPSIGYDPINGGGMNGTLANVQIYNSSLTANEILALYQEGIGGVPVKLQNIVGWWPLNGNANDYSGNLNNGVPTGVTYTSSWTAGYTAP